MGKVIKVAATVVGIGALAVVTAGVGLSAVAGLSLVGSLSGIGFFASTLGVSSAFLVSAAAGGLATLAGSRHPKTSVNPASQSTPPRLLAGGIVQRANLHSARHRSSTLPIKARSHRRRFELVRAEGDCMEPYSKEGALMLVDRAAEIRPDDLVVFTTASGEVLSKRFVTATGDRLEFESTNPQVERFSIARADLASCYRVRSYAKSWLDAALIAFRIMRRGGCNERLGICVFP